MRVSQETHSNQLQALESENDLREQLKKYVGMVQAQRRESSTKLKTTEGAAQMAFGSSGN